MDKSSNKRINAEKFYTPNDMVQMGIMTASNKDTQKQMLLRFIREGRIESLNLGSDKKPRYVVQGKNIIKYMDRQIKPGQYLKK